MSYKSHLQLVNKIHELEGRLLNSRSDRAETIHEAVLDLLQVVADLAHELEEIHPDLN